MQRLLEAKICVGKTKGHLSINKNTFTNFLKIGWVLVNGNGVFFWINAQGLAKTQLQLSLEPKKDILYCCVFITGSAVVQVFWGGKPNKSSIQLYTDSCVFLFLYFFYLFIYNI